ncbi:MAG: conjugal transfer protein TraH [Candidatus Nitrospinota bacterium M3_3B_026]
MAKRCFTGTVITALLLAAILSPPARAGEWIDDWLDQKTSTDMGYYEGQRRGYWTAGSFSARWRDNTDYPATLEPPRVSAGCGGIDVMTGSFSMLSDSDYLMDKGRSIIESGVAYYAYDIALDTLCPQCAKAMKSLESISDMLNQLQFNDCQAARVLVAKMAGKEDDPKYRASVDSYEAMKEDVSDSWYGVRESWTESGGEPVTRDSDRASDCAGVLSDLFGPATDTSVLEVIRQESGYPREWMDLARGLVGDVILKRDPRPEGGHDVVPAYIEPCSWNMGGGSAAVLLAGDAQARPADGGECRPVSAAAGGLNEWAYDRIDEIIGALESGSEPGLEQKQFLNSFPMPVYPVIKAALSSGQVSDSEVNSLKLLLAGAAARVHALKMMDDLYRFAGGGVMRAESSIRRRAPSCANAGDLVQAVLREMEILQRRLDEAKDGIRKEYEITLKEYHYTMRTAEWLRGAAAGD